MSNATYIMEYNRAIGIMLWNLQHVETISIIAGQEGMIFNMNESKFGLMGNIIMLI